MMKSKQSGQIISNGKTLDDVIEGLTCNRPLTCMYVIRFCVVNKVTDKRVVDIIKDLKTSDMIEWNSCRISDCAYAALDLLGIEKYEGDKMEIRDFIDTVFYTQMDGVE